MHWIPGIGGGSAIGALWWERPVPKLGFGVMTMIALVRDNLDEIGRLCREYGVEYLDVFGSAVNGSFSDKKSDVDFLVEFLDYGSAVSNRFLGLAEDLEALLGRPVDLITDRSIKNRFFRRSVDRAREPVFGERRFTEAS